MSRLRTAAQHLGLAAIACWPTITQPLTRMAGHPDADVWNHAWGPWWFWDCLVHGRLPWRTELLYAPIGGTLWFIDPLGALLGMLLVPVAGVQAAYNAVILLWLALASLGAARLAERLSGPGWHTWIASAALLFGPYLLGELHNGISEAVNVGPGLLALAAADAAYKQGGARRWATLAGLLVLTALGSMYYALAAALVVALWGLLWLPSRPAPRELLGAGGAAATAALGAGAVAALMRSSVVRDDPLVFRASGQVEHLLAHNAVDPRTYLWPGGFQSVDLAAQGEAFLHSGYLGWTVLALAAVGLWRTRAWAWIAAAAMCLAIGLGPYLFWEGEWVTTSSGARISLPYAWLSRLLPAQAITHALRLALPGLALIGALAAAGAAALRPGSRAAALLLVALDMVLFGGSPWPVARTPGLDLGVARELATATPLLSATASEPPPGPVVAGRDAPRDIVLDLPGAVGNTMASSRYFLYQAVHGRPVPYRPDARAVTSSLMQPASPLSVALVLLSEQRPDHREQLVNGVRRKTALDSGELARRGIAWVVVHRDLERGAQQVALTEKLLTQLYGEPKVSGSDALYTVRDRGLIPLQDPELKAIFEPRSP